MYASLLLILLLTELARRHQLRSPRAHLLAAISLTYGMPLVVEVGIFFDVLVAALLLAILIYRIRETFDSMDVSRLSRLRG